MSHDKNIEADLQEVDDPGRRDFLTKVSLTLSGLIGVVVAPPLLAALSQPLLDNPAPQWRDVGALSRVRLSRSSDRGIQRSLQAVHHDEQLDFW